ncbi:GyrI-like domain-containing protein [Christensenella intestinihominis]|uniref:GyrI-like domain-containing protein n=1 Tax=Christensenella intestinihominis TaxID=1851429 RepID=UPI00082D4CC6|nr:GyrI-like domain-containing protein [Christensenella intestinihominis]
MPDKLDYKKEYKDLYLPKAKPMLVDVPPINFIMVDGKGAPGGAEYQGAVGALYALTFTIKMSKMGGMQPEGYFEYVVPPLEGLWYGSEEGFDLERRDEWRWISMIRQPEFVTPDVFGWAVEECRRKKPDVDVSKARLETFREGLCVQMMHIGPYSGEAETIKKLHRYIGENGLENMTGNERKHHEIYLGDPRRTAPERLRTVLRLPVERKEA